MLVTSPCFGRLSARLSTVSTTSVISTHTNRSQLATAKPHTPLIDSKPIHPPLPLETPNINDLPTISDNNIVLADVQRSVQHTSGQHQAIVPQKARPYPDFASKCSSTAGRLCPLINHLPRYTINATTQLLATQKHHFSSAKFGWCFSLSPCSTCQLIHHMPTCYTSVPPGSRDLHTCAARAFSCRQPAQSTSAISPCERCCLRKIAAGIRG